MTGQSVYRVKPPVWRKLVCGSSSDSSLHSARVMTSHWSSRYGQSYLLGESVHTLSRRVSHESGLASVRMLDPKQSGQRVQCVLVSK